MKSTIIGLVTLFTITSLIASGDSQGDFGSIDDNTRLKWEEQRVRELVGSSQNYRASMSKGRSIAGKTEQELQWSSEFEDLMNSKNDDDVDYLELSQKL